MVAFQDQANSQGELQNFQAVATSSVPTVFSVKAVTYKSTIFTSENIPTHCAIVIKFSGRGPTTFIKPNKIFFVTKKKYFTYELENIQTSNK